MNNFEATPLHTASRFNQSELVKVTQLLQPAGCIFLVAILIDVLQILLDNGADIEAEDLSAMTPLHFAARDGAVEAAEVQRRCLD